MIPIIWAYTPHVINARHIFTLTVCVIISRVLIVTVALLNYILLYRGGNALCGLESLYTSGHSSVFVGLFS